MTQIVNRENETEENCCLWVGAILMHQDEYLLRFHCIFQSWQIGSCIYIVLFPWCRNVKGLHDLFCSSIIVNWLCGKNQLNVFLIACTLYLRLIYLFPRHITFILPRLRPIALFSVFLPGLMGWTGKATQNWGLGALVSNVHQWKSTHEQSYGHSSHSCGSRPKYARYQTQIMTNERCIMLIVGRLLKLVASLNLEVL